MDWSNEREREKHTLLVRRTALVFTLAAALVCAIVALPGCSVTEAGMDGIGELVAYAVLIAFVLLACGIGFELSAALVRVCASMRRAYRRRRKARGPDT